jgi:Ni/Co efflux regulator RcnB
MKRRWWITACGAVLLALTSSCAVAQDRGQDRGDQGRGDKGENRGQAKKHYRQFNDNQRQAARQYYKQHQGEPVFQRNQWNNDYESRLQPGYVLDSDMRRLSRPAPRDLIRGLGPAPRGYRYIVVGGHVVLVDNGYRVHDAIHLELNF